MWFERLITRICVALYVFMVGAYIFVPDARAYDNRYFGSFTTTNWSSQYGFQTCRGYSGARPCISDGTYFGTNTGDVVFSYSTYSISNSISTTSAMRTSSGSNYFAIDMMTGPRNNEQGNKTEYVVITVTRKNIQGNPIGMVPFTFNQSVSNTTMETYAFDIGSLANVYSIDVTISGRDGGYWAGNYGAVLGANSVYFTDTDPTAPAAPTYSSAPTTEQLNKRTNTRSIQGSGIYINQVGDNLDLDIVQYGDDNLVAGVGTTANSIVDANISGDDNTVSITQGNSAGSVSDNNVVLIGVNGTNNNLTVRQGDNVDDVGEARLILDVTGNYNTVGILQQNDGMGVGDEGHFMSVDIDGNSNIMYMDQKDDGDKIMFVDINGSSNDIDLIQQGTGEHFLDVTAGSNQTIDVNQDGSGNMSATIDMSGYTSGLDLDQTGTSNQTYSLTQNCVNSSGCGVTTVTQQ